MMEAGARTELVRGVRFAFGPFTFYPHERRLERQGRRTVLGGRASDILWALTENAGEIVDQRVLVERVWPQLHVEEGNLRVQIRALRKALSDEAQTNYIVNVPGLGYRFTAPVQIMTPAVEPPETPEPLFYLPRPLARMIGRQEVLDEVTRKLLASRFVTLVGPGGTGKTTVALAVANQMLTQFSGAVCFVDLSGVGDEHLTASAVASALRLQVQDADPAPSIIGYLKGNPMLIVLDCCEPVVRSVADLAQRLHVGAPGTHLLATSREPTRAEGEQIQMLSALEAPDENVAADDVYSFPAAELLLERATAAGARIDDTQSNALAAAEICRRLDGIPLAIELAAARIVSFGLKGVAARLDDRLKLLTQGYRAAQERHRTLRSVLDWSYALLSDDERVLLCNLSQFVGRFPLEAALFVGADGESVLDPEGAIAQLTAKSMLVAEPGVTPLFRLLDTTIIYGQEKLHESEAASRVAHRHAEYFAQLLNRAWDDRELLFERGGYETLAYHLGSVRSALKWCFSETGDPALGVRLAVGAGIYFVELGLYLEAYEWTARALEVMGDEIRGTKSEAVLRYGFAHGAAITKGNSEIAAKAMSETLEVAGALKEYDILLRTLGGLHIFLTRTSQFPASNRVSAQAHRIATAMNDQIALAMAESMMAHDYHYAGDQANAEAFRLSVLRRAPLDIKINTIRMGLDQRVRMMAAESRLFWLLGRSVDALESARRSLAFSEREKNPTIAVMAYQAVATTAMFCGEWRLMGDVNARMLKAAVENNIRPFPEVATAFEGERLFRTGDPNTSIEDHIARFDALKNTRFNVHFLASGMVQDLLETGRTSMAHDLMQELSAETESTGQGLFLPEYTRLKAEISLAANPGETEDAKLLYEKALKIAREQSALGWELRAATGLARLYQAEDRAQGRDILLPVLERFTDGYVTPDIAAARQVLHSLA